MLKPLFLGLFVLVSPSNTQSCLTRVTMPCASFAMSQTPNKSYEVEPLGNLAVYLLSKNYAVLSFFRLPHWRPTV